MQISHKKNPFRNLIKYIKKTRREAYWKLQIPWWYVLLLLCAVICFALSYSHRDSCGWGSSLLQSCGVGIITGIVIFVLGNIRGQTKDYVDRKVERLSNMYAIQKKINESVPDRVMLKLSGKKYNYAHCAYQAIEAASEYVEAMKKLDFFILKAFMKETNTDINDIESKINQIRARDISENLSYLDAVKIQGDIIAIIQNATEWFESWLREAELQKEQMRKYPL